MRPHTKLFAVAAFVSLGSALVGCSGASADDAEEAVTQSSAALSTLAGGETPSEPAKAKTYEILPAADGNTGADGAFLVRELGSSDEGRRVSAAVLEGLSVDERTRALDAVKQGAAGRCGIVIGTIVPGQLQRGEAGIVIGTSPSPAPPVVDGRGIVIGTHVPASKGADEVLRIEGVL